MKSSGTDFSSPSPNLIQRCRCFWRVFSSTFTNNSAVIYTHKMWLHIPEKHLWTLIQQNCLWTVYHLAKPGKNCSTWVTIVEFNAKRALKKLKVFPCIWGLTKQLLKLEWLTAEMENPLCYKSSTDSKVYNLCTFNFCTIAALLAMEPIWKNWYRKKSHKQTDIFPSVFVCI